MAADLEIVRHVARLARLELSSEEEALFARDLRQILSYVDKLKEVDTAGIEPTARSQPLVNIMRVDEPHPSLPRSQLLANAPQTENGMFRVPRIL